MITLRILVVSVLLATRVFMDAAVVAAAPETKPRVSLGTLSLRDSDGKPIELLLDRTDAGPQSVRDGFAVFCFLGTECPLARLYGARLQELADQFKAGGVRFIGVNSNIQDSPAEISRYVVEHGIRFPIAKDADQSVALAFGATRTPEVIVVDASGTIRYRGRIDDQYEPGIARAKPTRHDLRDAIQALVDGIPVPNPKTIGVGCLITRIKNDRERAPTGASAVTFNRDIAPILHQHCVECHREGEIGPFALTDYDEVVGWGQMILEVIEQRRMPPWHADPTIGKFAGARVLPDADRKMLEHWVDIGMPEGEVTDMPKAPTWSSGWHLGSDPDLELKMSDQDFEVPARGTVEYQYFVVDPGWETDRWIRAAQVIPGNASVVHHAIVFVRPPDGSGFHGIGWLGAYVPGQRSSGLPAGHARHVPAGSKLVFQMHYTPNGRKTNDRTKLGIWFAKEDQVTHVVDTHLAINHEFEIPPGEQSHQVKMNARSFPRKGKLLGITPHMHFRGKAFSMQAIGKDGQTEPLLLVPRYDFNWQHWYQFEKPLKLRDVDTLSMTVTFDNSANNPFNPNPKEYVSWGDQTWEEMAVAFFDVAVPSGSARQRINRPTEPTAESMASRAAEIDGRVKGFFARLDKDNDGIILRDETPSSFQVFGFNSIDRNRDNRITEDEVRWHATNR
ncbi:MAG: redoxin domain-containing protein [Planctomycetota bacterium]